MAETKETDAAAAALSRRGFLRNTAAALAATAAAAPLAAGAQSLATAQTKDMSHDTHTGVNEKQLRPENKVVEDQEPDSVFPPTTDARGQPPFKYPFAFGHRRVEEGGWTRQVTVRDFPLSKKMAGVEMRLIKGGVRELHWHPNDDEWQYYMKGTGRMTVFSAGGHARTMDFHPGDVGYIDQSLPHCIENLGDDDLVFLEVFPTPFYEDISLAEWLAHTPSRLVDQHIETGESFLKAIPKTEAVATPLK